MFNIRKIAFLKQRLHIALLGILALGCGAPAMAIMADDIMWFSNVRTGLWEIKDRNSGELVDKICVSKPKQLLQLRHRGPLCQSEVLRQDAAHAYVYYQCGAKGHGYTNVIMESGGLMQIASQGLYENGPFQFSVEARHIGTCP